MGKLDSSKKVIRQRIRPGESIDRFRNILQPCASCPVPRPGFPLNTGNLYLVTYLKKVNFRGKI